MSDANPSCRSCAGTGVDRLHDCRCLCVSDVRKPQWDAARALELAKLLRGGRWDHEDYVDRAADMLRAAVAEVERLTKDWEKQYSARRDIEQGYDRLAAENATLRAELEQERCRDKLIDKARELAFDILRQPLPSEMEQLAFIRRRDKQAIQASNMIIDLIARLEAAESFIQALSPSEWKHHERYQAWRAIRDAKEGTT